MIVRTFNYRESEFGEGGFYPGWVPDSPGLISIDSRTAAHDSLEHMPSWTGFEGEMMAFGQMYFIRVDGHMVSDWELLRGMRIDFADFIPHVLNGDETLQEPPAAAKRLLERVALDDYGMGPCWHDLDDAVHQGLRDGIARFANERNRSKDEVRESLNLTQARNRIMAWFYFGYAHGRRRWERIGLGPHHVADLFRGVQDRVSMLDLDNQEEGERITVRIDTGARRVRAYQHHRSAKPWLL